MDQKKGDNNDNKQPRFYPSLMDLYFEEEDSQEFDGAIDDMPNSYSNISSSYSDEKKQTDDDTSSDAKDMTEGRKQKKKMPKRSTEPRKRKKAEIDDLDIPQDILNMITNNNFLPFGCTGKKKSITTINRILYLLQRMNVLTMDHCTLLTEDDSRRIYDIMNVLIELELVKKNPGNSRTSSPVIRSNRRKIPTTFEFCSKVRTDNPVDLKELQKYLS